MKIAKKKEVVTEEIEIKAGTYYFECDLISYCFTLKEEDEWGHADFKLETLTNFGNVYGIRIREDYCDSESIPYDFKQFILGEAGKEITEEEFKKEKEEILKRL